MIESFWENEELQQTPLNESLISIQKKLGDLELEVEQAKEQLDYLEILRARQHQQLFKLQDEFTKHFDVTQYPEYERLVLKEKPLIELFSIPDQQILKITMNFLLPIYHKTKNTKFSYYIALQDIYQQQLIRKLLHNRMTLPNFESSAKVFVLIVQYFNNNIISDLDNRFHSFIFNAFRSARITPDDRWQKLSYMEDGRKTEGKPYTEIFLGNYENMSEIIQFSNTPKN